MRRSAAIAFALVLLAALFLALAHRAWRPLHANATSAARVDEPTRAGPRSRAAASAPPLEPRSVERNAADAAATWLERADAAIAAKRARQFGAEIAAIAALPPGEAWEKLTQLARDGEPRAAAAALMLANECKGLQSLRDLPRRAAHAMDGPTKGLAPEWRAFAAAIDSAQLARLAKRTDGCRDVGGVMDFVEMALDRFITPDNPEIQLAAAADIENDDEAIAALRALAGGSQDAQRELGERLIKSRDAAAAAEGFLLLQSLADGDESAAEFLAFCLHDGCGGFPPDPAAPAQWMERAAGSGNPAALQEYITDLIAAQDIASAWAWASYRLELALNGCFESGGPTSAWVLQAAQTLFALEPQLSAAQRTQAQAAMLAIRQRWLPSAIANLGCSV